MSVHYTYGKKGEQRVHEHPFGVRAYHRTAKTWPSARLVLVCARARLLFSIYSVALSPIATLELLNPIAVVEARRGQGDEIGDIGRLIVTALACL